MYYLGDEIRYMGLIEEGHAVREEMPEILLNILTAEYLLKWIVLHMGGE